MGIGFKQCGHRSPDQQDDTHAHQQILFLEGWELEVEPEQESEDHTEFSNGQVQQVYDPPGTVALVHSVQKGAY
jgi:hypothetical protein